jgi:hypothetical protein
LTGVKRTATVLLNLFLTGLDLNDSAHRQSDRTHCLGVTVNVTVNITVNVTVNVTVSYCYS